MFCGQHLGAPDAQYQFVGNILVPRARNTALWATSGCPGRAIPPCGQHLGAPDARYRFAGSIWMPRMRNTALWHIWVPRALSTALWVTSGCPGRSGPPSVETPRKRPGATILAPARFPARPAAPWSYNSNSRAASRHGRGPRGPGRHGPGSPWSYHCSVRAPGGAPKRPQNTTIDAPGRFRPPPASPGDRRPGRPGATMEAPRRSPARRGP